MTTQPDSWRLEEGHLAIDFINTAYLQIDQSDHWGYRTVEESLHALSDLAAWADQHGILTPSLAESLRTNSNQTDPHLAELITLRESMRRIFRAHIGSGPDASTMLTEINQRLLPSLEGTVLRPSEAGFVPDRLMAKTSSAQEAINQITWAIALSTEALLTDPKELALIKECPAEDCGYLFRDSSRGRRRWCSMATCGNRAKVHRFREKTA